MIHNNSSPMSISRLLLYSDQSEKLGIDKSPIQEPSEDKKDNITLPSLPILSTTSPNTPLPTPSNSFISHERLSFSSDSTLNEEEPVYKRHKQNNFINRVSNIPLVHSAMKVYESSKNSSSVMKYSVEKVESLVGPIYDKFGKQALLGVDEWGCKQLDKLEEKYPNYITRNNKATLLEEPDTFCKRQDIQLGSHRSKNSFHSSSLTNNKRSTVKSIPTQTFQTLESGKWRQIVTHASAAANSTAAVISEESMKCLKYCISWLQYASHHIEHQVSLLSGLLESPPTDNSTSIFNNIKKEIVTTLRKVVNVVSKFSGNTLSEHAKDTVRSCILSLPSKWENGFINNVCDIALKLLNFAKESIDMINKVICIFYDSVQKTEQWITRLREVEFGSNSLLKRST